jgi:succinoglycan biosynthesis transport protein ExoP
MNSPDTERPLSLLDYVRPVLSRWWIVLIVVIVSTAGTYVYYDRQPKVFKATTRIFTNSEAAIPGTNTDSQETGREAQNAATLLTSRSTATVVARKLSFRASPQAIAGSLTAVTTEGTDFITITATRGTGAQAAELANTVAEQFIASRSAAARRSLEQYLAQLQDQIVRLPRKAENAAERTGVASKIRQVKLQLALPQGNASQLDPALVPGFPESPRPKRNALFAFALSLLVAIGLAFGLERFDRRLKRVEEIEDVYGLPLLSVLPHSSAPEKFGSDGGAEMAPEFIEAFRQLRTNVQLGSLERPVRRILVTSAVPGEGKSTVARNLAIAYREFGRSVIVVDADLRRPSQGRMFGLDSDRGLTSVLTGELRLDEALLDAAVDTKGLETLARIEAATATAVGARPVAVDDSAIRGIGVLLSGGRSANPQAVLAAGSTAALLEQLEEQADVVIIDSPPLLAVSDALALARDADAIILVARMGLSTRDGAARAREALDRVPNVRLAGVVVNDTSGLDDTRYGYADGYGDAG